METDVLIFGAGPAGCATALALAGQGVRSVVLHKPVQVRFRIGESATPDVPGLLRQLGLSGDLAAAGHRPCHGNLSLWGGVRVFDDFLRRGQGPAWHLDRARFDADLQAALPARGVTLCEGAALREILPAGEGWRVDLGPAGVIVARVLVDAAGRRAPLATRLGAARVTVDGLVALAVKAPAYDRLLAATTLVEPCAEGWWYAAPLPDGQAMVTLMTDSDLAAATQFRNVEQYEAAWRASPVLADLVPVPAGGIDVVTSFAAQSGFLTKVAGSGWIAAGDALLGFDPLTSSGISGALRDGLAAADVIGGWLRGEPPAALAQTYAGRLARSLEKYLRDRQRHYAAEQRWPDSPFWQRRQQARDVRIAVGSEAVA